MQATPSPLSDPPLEPQFIFRSGYTSEEPDPQPLRLINEAPPWRTFGKKTTVDGDFETREMDLGQVRLGKTYQVDAPEARLVSAALTLRRPLLISGHAGMGKSSLAYAIAWQLGLGNVLRWSITSRSTLKEALYEYDAVARLQDASLRSSGIENSNAHDVGRYITLGPLGTALLPNPSGPFQPRVLLIDEIDKSDLDLPNDLLHVLENGSFEIPEIARSRNSSGETPTVHISGARTRVEIPASGSIQCTDFPLVILTTNGEREFSPAFRRRCLEIVAPHPSRQKLENIVRAQMSIDGPLDPKIEALIGEFEERSRSGKGRLAIDQLLNGIYLSQSKIGVDPLQHDALLKAVFHSLGSSISGS